MNLKQYHLRAEDNVLTTLNGIYDVYYFSGTIYFEEKESK